MHGRLLPRLEEVRAHEAVLVPGPAPERAADDDVVLVPDLLRAALVQLVVGVAVPRLGDRRDPRLTLQACRPEGLCVVTERRDDPDAGEGVSLLCRNLGYNTDKEVVRNAFKEFGRVVDVYLPLDYMTKQPRGFAFVEMGDRRSAAAAIDGLDGRQDDPGGTVLAFLTHVIQRESKCKILAGFVPILPPLQHGSMKIL